MNYTLHNIADINKDNDGFFSIYRFTEDVRNSMDNDFGKTIANTVISGSEIRFVINSGKALLKIIYEGEEMYSPKVYMNFGTFQGAWIWKDSVTLKNGLNEIEVWYPENIDTLLEISANKKYIFSPRVVRILLPNGIRLGGVQGDIRNPKPEELPSRSIVFYGSSITHGSNSLNVHSSYASICGRLLNTDVINKGMPGSCYLENKMVDFVFSHTADAFVAELGTNCYSKEKHKWFVERVENVIDAHKRLCCDKPLLLIDMFRYENEPDCVKAVKDIVSATKNKKIAYISGCEILDDVRYYSSDLVHPNVDGHILIAQKVSQAIMKEKMLYA